MHQVLERLEEDYNSAEFEGNVVEQVSVSLYFVHYAWEDTIIYLETMSKV